ncbi:MAG TPA: PhzF family phenazine biosynthesis protein [Candidatus Polarisedimenticolia bacterium]|nr:PhzF family phenazine biosynthesis protein [Candidatus Polarisedimenticolia bacterium]
MPQYPMMLVDAFTSVPLAGNACAVLFETDGMSPETMQAIAREMNLSETAFARRSTIADVGARYYTPGSEIPLAGHPTIATIYALVRTGRLTMKGDVTPIALELRDGPIQVEVRGSGGVIKQVVMTQRKPEFGAPLDANEVMPLFGLTPADLHPGGRAGAGRPQIQVVSTGTPQLMVPVRDLDALKRVTLDPRGAARLKEKAGFFSIHLFTTTGATPHGRTFARHFGVPPDTFEDPFTGSATGGMGAFLWRHRLIDTPTFVAEQGHWMHRPGEAQVEVVGPPDAIETVKVGGAAVSVMEGTITL